MDFLKLTLLASLLAVGLGADSCTNPLFQAEFKGQFGPIKWDVDIDIASKPSTFPACTGDSCVCKAFQGQESCCDANTLKLIGEASADVQKGLDQAKSAWDAVSFDGMAAALSAGCFVSPNPSSCNGDIKSATTEFKNSLDQVVSANINCATGMAAYERGILCFACKPNPLQYVDTKAKIIKLAQDTCDNLYDDCSPVFTSYSNMVSKILDLVNSITKQFGLSIKISWSTDLCDGQDCKQFLCHELIDGVAASMPSVPSFAPGRRQRRRAVLSVEGGEDRVGLAQALQQQLDAMAEAFEAAQATRAGKVAMPATYFTPARPGRTLVTASASTSHTTYESSGYNAYKVGCTDIDCPSHINVVAIAIGCGVAAVVVALVVVVAVRRRRGSARSGGMAQTVTYGSTA